jgi:hypothetical protein
LIYHVIHWGHGLGHPFFFIHSVQNAVEIIILGSDSMRRIHCLYLMAVLILISTSISEARWYSPAIGRFLSVDPLGYAGGDANLYRFAGNNPVSFADPWGLWSPGAHDYILKYAFRNRLSKQDISRLQLSSRNFDRQTQAANKSHMHSMRLKNQTVGKATGLMNQFIADKLNKAREFAQCGNRNAALDLLGEALHPLMDSSSPMHVDADSNPKVWNPWWPFGHSPNESIGDETVKEVTLQILQQQQPLLNNAYDRVFGP